MRIFEIYLPGMTSPTETVEAEIVQFENGTILFGRDKNEISHVFPPGSSVVERIVNEESILNQLKGIQEDITTVQRQILEQGPLSSYTDGEMILILKTIIDRVDHRCIAAAKLKFKSVENPAGKPVNI